MKAMNRILSVLFLSMAFLFTSCQDEITELIDETESETISSSSPLVGLVQRTTARDGSFDNIIDGASCLSVELPVTVIVNGLEIIIDSEEDLEVIEDIFEESDFDEDILDIIFPITIITSDHREITIESLEELRELAADCVEGGDDDDIECIDFKYPLTISVFDAENNLIDTLTFESDEHLYRFFEDLDDDVFLSFNFPLTIQLASGLEITVQNHDQLEDLIESAVEDCDEDDDNDYDDDDCEDCTIERVAELMTTCDWSVDKLILERTDQQEQYVDYLFTFFEDGSVEAGVEGGRVEGTWELVNTDEGIKLELNIEELPDFDGPWRLHEIEDDDEIKIDFRRGDDRLRFEKVCENDGGNSGIAEVIVNGTWEVARYDDSGTDETAQFADYVFEFTAEGTVDADNGSGTVSGTWSEVVDSGENKFVLDFGTNMPLDEFNDDWDIVSVEENRVELKDVSGGDGTTDILVFEKRQ